MDLVHARMAADMSKKMVINYSDSRTTNQLDGSQMRNSSLQAQLKSDRLYNSVSDCFAKSNKAKNSLFAGLPVALAHQIPHSVILLTSFDILATEIDNQERYDKYDEYNFTYKFIQRLGASTLAITLATSICYPLDTLKRRY